MSRRLLLGCLLVAFTLAGVIAAATGDVNHPTGTRGLFLVDKVAAHLRFLDPNTFQQQADIEVGKNPHDFVLTPDHKLAYVPIYGDGIYGRNSNPGHEIDIVDMEQHKVSATIDIAPYRAPHGIQLGASGMLYVTCDLDRKVLVIDPKARKIVSAIDTEGTGHWIALLPDESKLYVTNKKDRPFISVLDLKTRKMIGKVPAPGGTQGIAASPDGKIVVAMDLTEPVMIVIDPKTDTVKDRIPQKDQTRGGYKVYFSPDGKKLLTMSSAHRLVNIFDGSNLRGEQKTLPTGRDPMGFAFSADGKTVLVANHGDGTITVIDLPKLEVVKTFQAGTGIETLTYY